MENDNGFIPGHVTAIPMLLNVGDLNMGWQTKIILDLWIFGGFAIKILWNLETSVKYNTEEHPVFITPFGRL
jgi:hypothetical protein